MALAGQVLIPIPVVGALIGGFVGAALSEVFFNALNSKKVELARLSLLSLVTRTLSWDWVRKNSMSEAMACQGLCGISIN